MKQSAQTTSSSISDFRETFDLLYPKVGMLWARWKLYTNAYSSEQNVQRMNEISPSLFWFIQESMIHDLIRIVYALTDKPASGKVENLAMSRLVQQAEVAFPHSSASIKGSLDLLNRSATAIRSHRNKRLMHFDFETAKAQNANLPRLLFDDLQSSITRIGEVMSHASVLLNDQEILYDFTVTANTEGALEWLLHDSVRFNMLRKLANDPTVADSVVREMVKHRSSRNDPPQFRSK